MERYGFYLGKKVDGYCVITECSSRPNLIQRFILWLLGFHIVKN